MSDEQPFELEWPGEDREPPAAPAPTPRRRAAAPPRRARTTRRGRTTGTAPTRSGGRLRRTGRALVGPTCFYVLGLVSLGGLVPVLFNPGFGGEARAWPQAVLGMDGGTFRWDLPTLVLLKLGIVALACAVALGRRPGKGPATFVLFAVSLGLLAWPVPPDWMRFFLVPVALALTVGALGAGRGGRLVLLVGLAVLAVHLFLPTVPGSDYDPPALATVREVLDAPAAVAPTNPFVVPVEHGGLLGVLVHRLPELAAMLVLLLGLLGLLGLGRRWAAGAAALVLLLAWAGTLAALYGQGSGGELAAWEQGLTHLGLAWPLDALAYALPLAAAVAERFGASRA